MNVFDVAIIIALTAFVYFGAKSGGAKELGGVIGWIVALLLAARGADVLAAIVTSRVSMLSHTMAMILSFVIILLAIRTLFYLLAKGFEKSADKRAVGQIDRFIGALIGFVKGAFAVSVLVLLFYMVPFNETVKRQQSNSVLFTHMHTFAVGVVNLVFHYIPEVRSPLENTLDKFQTPPPDPNV